MKLLFLYPFNKKDLKYLLNNLDQKYEIIIPDNYSDNELEKFIIDAEVLLGNRISKTLIDKAKKLKLFQNIGAGVDRIDLSLFKDNNIILGNSHTNTFFVAEYAIALMFSLLKKIHHHDRLMRNGEWFKPSGEHDQYFLSDTILGKRIGILGFGGIGKNIAKMLSGFNNQFLVSINDKKKNRSINRNIEYVDLNILLSNSDIIFNTLPLTNKTYKLIGTNQFKEISQNAYLINISRAEIIEKASLFNALSDNKIKGAALDVWYPSLIST